MKESKTPPDCRLKVDGTEVGSQDCNRNEQPAPVRPLDYTLINGT